MTNVTTVIKAFFAGQLSAVHIHHEVDIFVGMILLAGAGFAYAIASRRVRLDAPLATVVMYAICGLLVVGGLDHLELIVFSTRETDPLSLEEWVGVGVLAVTVGVILPWLLYRFFFSKKAIESLTEGIEETKRSAQLAQAEREVLSQRYAESADALRMSIERAYRFAALVESSRDAVIGVNEDGTVWQWNASAEALFKRASLDMVGASIASVPVSPSGDLWREILRLSSPPFLRGFDEISVIAGDGATLPVWISVSKVPSSPGSASGFAIVARDLTEKKRVEETISAALAEKNLLLKEVHHRVKNNLQLICSLLRLQSKEAADKEALVLFRKSEDRIRSLALVHERLYRSDNLSTLDFGGYVRDLVGQLVRSAEAGGAKVSVDYDVDAILFPVDNAITCGLIVHELVANSLKHREGPDIKLRVGLWRTSSAITFSVWDDGTRPIDPNLFEGATTLGLKLVRSLAHQLGGSIGVNQEEGTEFKIELP